jgi:hypothetical protein
MAGMNIPDLVSFQKTCLREVSICSTLVEKVWWRLKTLPNVTSSPKFESEDSTVSHTSRNS